MIQSAPSPPSQLAEINDTVQVATETSIAEKITVNEKPKVKSVFAAFREFSGGEIVNLDNGIKLVCLFSLDCEDCMQTAFKLGQAKNDWKNFPKVYILFLGEEEQVNNFFDAAAMTFPLQNYFAANFLPAYKKLSAENRLT